MPSEPFPWDRRDFRKHERSATDPRFAAAAALNRWREQPQHPIGPPPFQPQRWFSDFRSPRLPPPAEGHGKQGGWPVNSNEAGLGFVPLDPRYADRKLEDENCRPFVSRGNGRYIRNNRENRNPFTRKDWRAPTWEPAKSPCAPANPIADVSNLMSVENTQQCSSRVNSFAPHVPPSSVNLSEKPQPQILMKEMNNKNCGTVDETADAGLESGKENCLESVDWKPLKLARMGSLSSTSRGSCFSRSSSSKSVGVGPSSIVADVKPNTETVVQPPADDGCFRSTSPVLSDENGSRRKRRLGWGEGLAKYEKKRVEGPEDCVHKNELVVNVSNTDTPQCESVGQPEKSPRVASLLDCASPGTPHSVACSSSPVIEEKRLVKEADVGDDATNLRCSPSMAVKIPYGASTLNLKNLELASIANLSLLINDLLQTDGPTSAETGHGRTTSMNKLLVWKVDMLRALEMTESEIESLETELKSLIAEPSIFCSMGPSSLSGEQLKPCEELVTASKCGNKLVPLQINSSREMITQNAPVGPEDVHVLLKGEDIDSPGSATSRYVEDLASEVTEGSMNLNVDSSRNLDDKSLNSGLSYEQNSGYVENHVHTETNLEDLAGVSSGCCRVDNGYELILSSNRDAARKCMEQLNKFLPEHYFKSSVESSMSSLQSNPSVVKTSMSSLQSNPSVVKTKILMRKRFLQFKEKVLTLKFKAFRHFWKEGRVLSPRRLRGKTRKKFDPSRHGHKRIHSRVSSDARGLHTVPADEVIELVNGLLSESAFKPHGSTLKMPAMILDKEVKLSRFMSKNGLVEDPCSVEKERSMLNQWTPEETEIFVDKLAAFGKDFRKIASFLDRRSVADCIEFYYKNHKSKCFEKIKKIPASTNQIKSPSKTYLVASGKRRNPELNASSLDILGAASEVVANIDNGINNQLKLPPIISCKASSSCEAPRDVDGLLRGSNSSNTDSDKRETEAADVLASICGSISSEGVSSCITSSVDKPSDGYQDHGVVRIDSSTEQPLTPDDDDDEMSDESCGELNSTDWSDEEKSIFIQAVSFYGKDFVMVSQSVRTRSEYQCKLFFSKARKCLKLDQIQPGGELETALVDDEVCDSGIEDGCTVETGSVIRDNDSDSSMEENHPPPDMKLNHQSDVVEPQNLRPDLEMSEVFAETVVVSSEQGVEGEEGHCMVEAENKAMVEVSGPSLPEGNLENEIVEDIRTVVSEAKSEPHPLTNISKSEPQPLTNISAPSTNDCQQHLPGHSSDSIASSQVLWGYPVPVQTKNERIGDVKCENPTARPVITEQNGNLSTDRHTESFLMKCDGSRQQSKVVEGPFPSLGQSRDCSRLQSSSSTGEGPSRNGDVKLFGTILNSSQQKTNSFVQITDGNNRQDHKIGHTSLSLNLGAHQAVNPNLDYVQPKFDGETYVGKTDHVPVGSVGFWDGNRIRTGIRPLPDSALLLAKYPAAFTNSSVFPASSSHSHSPAEYRYPQLQPFTIGMNQRQDSVFNEVRRRNGFDLGSGMPNVVGRGRGVYGGGQGLSLSDPMALMRMQYDANIEQLRMKGGKLMKEVDRWISGRGGGMQ